MVKIERNLGKFLEAELLQCCTDEKMFLDYSPWSSLDRVFVLESHVIGLLIGEECWTKVWKTLVASHEPCHSD